MKQGIESLQNFLQRPETTEARTGIQIERLVDGIKGDEAIKIYVDPRINDWQTTEIGTIKVNPITKFDTRNGFRREVRVDFKDDAKDLQPYDKRSDKGRSNRHRTIPIDEQGIGWDELGRAQHQTPEGQRWLIIDTGLPINQNPM